jgi:hypothetical protein
VKETTFLPKDDEE